MPKKIYNVNSPPVKRSAKVQPGKNLKFKKLKTKKYSMNTNQRYMLTMKSEICAYNNVVVLYPLRQDGSPGFVYNVHQSVMKQPETKHPLLKEEKLDCSYLKYPYSRASRDDNSRVRIDSATTNTSQYSKTCFVAVPNQEEYCNKNGELNEAKIVTDMEIAYCESLKDKKTRDEVFTPRNIQVDSNTKKPNRALDNILTDESVTDILYAYFIPHHVPWSGVYQFMENEGLDGFFSKRSDGMYSKWAREKHGFPSGGFNSEMNENEASDNDDSTCNDEDDDLNDFIVNDGEDSEFNDDDEEEESEEEDEEEEEERTKVKALTCKLRQSIAYIYLCIISKTKN